MRSKVKEGTAESCTCVLQFTGLKSDMSPHAVSQEIAEELGCLSSDSSEEEVLTTRVVRRRVIIQVTPKFLRDDAASLAERWQLPQKAERLLSC